MNGSGGMDPGEDAVPTGRQRRRNGSAEFV